MPSRWYRWMKLAWSKMTLKNCLWVGESNTWLISPLFLMYREENRIRLDILIFWEKWNLNFYLKLNMYKLGPYFIFCLFCFVLHKVDKIKHSASQFLNSNSNSRYLLAYFFPRRCEGYEDSALILKEYISSYVTMCIRNRGGRNLEGEGGNSSKAQKLNFREICLLLRLF